MKLKEIRLKKGLTQEALANKLGIHTSAIAHYERGTFRMNVIRALQLAKVLECKVEDLFDEGEDYE